MSAFASYRRRETLAKSEAVRVAALLGLKSANRIDDVTLAERVAGGIEVEAAHALREMIEPLGPKAFYRIVSEPTLRRAGPRKRLTRGPSERVTRSAASSTAWRPSSVATRITSSAS